jgi:hypothetical protein
VHKVVVFILEDFEKFTGKRQAVFYNILDTMHGPDIQASSRHHPEAHACHLMLQWPTVWGGPSCSHSNMVVIWNMLLNKSTQAALVGTSQRQDVMDLLEKRIRSRFSHRRLLLGDPLIDPAPSGAAGQGLSALLRMVYLPVSSSASQRWLHPTACSSGWVF